MSTISLSDRNRSRLSQQVRLMLEELTKTYQVNTSLGTSGYISRRANLDTRRGKGFTNGSTELNICVTQSEHCPWRMASP